MEITININADAPLFAQLIEQIKQGVLSEELHPGDALPSIRQLANDLGINNKTVAKAYRLLERDSVIQTRGYRGTFVHPDAKTNSTVDLRALVVETLGEALTALRRAGVTDSEIRITFGELMNARNNRGNGTP